MGVNTAIISSLSRKAASYPGISKDELKSLKNIELDLLCESLNIEKCETMRKSKKIRHILNQVFKENITPEPPRGFFSRDQIAGLSSSEVRGLSKAHGISQGNTSIKRDKLMLYHGHSPIKVENVNNASLSQLRGICSRLSSKKGFEPGLNGCFTKASDINSVRMQILMTRDAESGTSYAS